MAKFIKLTKGAQDFYVNADRITWIASQDVENGYYKPAASLVNFGDEDASLTLPQTPEQILKLIEDAQ